MVDNSLSLHRLNVKFKIYYKCYQNQNLRKHKMKNEYYRTILGIFLVYYIH